MKSELVKATNHLNIGNGWCNGWIEQPEEIKSGIYCWISPSGKKYVGQSSNLKNRKSVFLNFKRRYGAPKSNYITYIDCARKKYNNASLWNYQILVYCNNDDLNEEEVFYIDNLHTTDRNIGYNMTQGGGGTRGWKMNEEQLKKHGERQRGKVMSKEAREKLSKAHKGRKRTPEQREKLKLTALKGENHPFYGKHLSNEVKEKIRLSHLGKKRSAESIEKTAIKNRLEVCQYDLQGRFIKRWKYAGEVETELSINADCINNVASLPELKPVGGFIWRRNPTDENIVVNREFGKGKKINQYTLECEFVREWRSAAIAEQSLGLCKSSINKCLRGKNKSAGGFIWRYFDDAPPTKSVLSKEKAIYQLTLNNEIIRTYSSIIEAATDNGLEPCNINICLHGKTSQSGGYKWRYVDNPEQFQYVPKSTKRPVAQCDLSGQIIHHWESSVDAARELGYTATNITACCKGKLKTYKKFIWRYDVK